MKNIILTASLVSLIFSAAMNYALITGNVSRTYPVAAQAAPEPTGYTQKDVDALGKLASLSVERGRK